MSADELSRNSDVLGYELFGSGKTCVIVTNDWLCDTSTWDGARAYLDQERFRFAFTDLRGYERSRALRGAFSVSEAASDVLALADALGWARYAIVGHSMSALVALHLAQHHADRVERAVVLTPPPPGGFGADDAMIAASRGLALADDATRLKLFAQLYGTRLSAGWTRYKVSQCRQHADPVAAAGYVAMFARDGLPEPAAPIRIPVLAITGERDAPPMRSDAVRASLGPLCAQLEVTPLADSGHYPMQEAVKYASAIARKRFLAKPCSTIGRG